MAIAKDKFANITTSVVNKLEGGYYNPLWHGVPKGFERSGETMFGIDRKAGGALNTSVAGKKFWSIIDANKSKEIWKHGYRGGSLENQLTSLAIEIMYPEYVRLSDKYLTEKASNIVNSDARLVFHFAYGTWNGAGWFKKFANDINKAINSGVTDTTKLTNIAIASRTKEGLKEGSNPNEMIAKSGKKIAGFINEFKTVAGGYATKGIKKAEENPILTASLSAVAVMFFLTLYKVITKNKN
jgi:hypothetical protein